MFDSSSHKYIYIYNQEVARGARAQVEPSLSFVKRKEARQWLDLHGDAATKTFIQQHERDPRAGEGPEPEGIP